MQAYGLSVLLRNSIGTRTQVLEDDSSKADDSEADSIIVVRSHLDSDQIKQLQALVEANSWSLAYRSYADDGYLAIVPDAN